MKSVPQAPQRAVDRLAHVLRAAVLAQHVLGGVLDHEPALGGQEDVVAAAGDRPADELLVRVRPVHVGGVEQRHAELERAVDGRDRLRLVALGGPVGPGHAHAAEADPARDVDHAVSRIGAASVMTIVCSKCAEGEPSSVRIVQPSSSTYTSPRAGGDDRLDRDHEAVGQLRAVPGDVRDVGLLVDPAADAVAGQLGADAEAAALDLALDGGADRADVRARRRPPPGRSLSADCAAATSRCSRGRTWPTGTVRQASA